MRYASMKKEGVTFCGGCSTPWVFFACTPRVLFVKLKNRVKEVDVRSCRNPKDLSDNKVTFTTKGSSWRGHEE